MRTMEFCFFFFFVDLLGSLLELIGDFCWKLLGCFTTSMADGNCFGFLGI